MMQQFSIAAWVAVLILRENALGGYVMIDFTSAACVTTTGQGKARESDISNHSIRMATSDRDDTATICDNLLF